jgi:hypothetical protein
MADRSGREFRHGGRRSSRARIRVTEQARAGRVSSPPRRGRGRIRTGDETGARGPMFHPAPVRPDRGLGRVAKAAAGMTGAAAGCGGPACSRPVARAATGRPARYCSPGCRQAAYRERVRQADAERARAEAARLAAWHEVSDQGRRSSASRPSPRCFRRVEDQ